MVINSSNVALSSSRHYFSHTETKQASIVTRGDEGVLFELSEESQSLLEQMQQYKEEMNKRQESNFQGLFDQIKKAENTNAKFEPEEDGEIILLRKLLEALEKMRDGKHSDALKDIKEVKNSMRNISFKGFSFGGVCFNASSSNAKVLDLRSQGAVSAGTGTVFTKTTATSSVFSEHELTSFSASGVAITEDGRKIDFNMDLEMSRAFTERYESLEHSTYVVCDPLVINLHGGRTELSDKKYFFDLNCDGKNEEISFAENGSGFIALDKNGDGKINDGNELFGTKSGDGFADLSAYDEDGNGWIDEADSVFKDLRVWTKDENGEDKLVNLLGADVGAIYLGNADTKFSVNEMITNETKGVIRKTGIFLKESGGAGTVQHVDIAI